MPFLDILVIPLSDGNGSLITTIYRKPTHTDQYLQWDSQHAISTKYSIISTLYHRPKTVCSNQQHLHEEQEHLQKVLTRCKYPEWALNRMKKKITAPLTPNDNNKKKPTSSNMSNIKRNYIVVPYTKGLSESFKNVGKKYDIQAYFKGGRTIKDLLVAPKDKDHITKKSGIIYRYKCGRVECKYIGECLRTFGERFTEHLKAPSPIFDHFNITGHNTTLENFSKVGKKDQNLMTHKRINIHKGQQSIPE